jgi:GH18 family chitinase
MVRCSNGKVTHRFSCSEGKVFNDLTKACEDPKYVNCQSSATKTMQNTSPSTEENNEFLFETTQSTISKTLNPISSSHTSVPISSFLSSEDSTTISSQIIANSNKDIISKSNRSTVFVEKPILSEETSTMNDKSFVEYVDEDNSGITTAMTTESPMTESTTSTTSSLLISNISPVLESTLQNQTTLIDTSVTEPTFITETNTKSNNYCFIDESLQESNSTNHLTSKETSKLLDLYKIVCYFTNWSRYRPDSAKFTVNDVNPFLCTHIIYSFAVLDNKTLTLKPSDECTDIDNKFYAQITGLKKKNPKLKVLIGLGGWVDSEGDKYSRLVSNLTTRSNFIDHVIKFIIKNSFDGLDLSWEFPKCWQSNCGAGPHSDQINFAKFIRELRIALNKQSRPLLLTAAVSANKEIIDSAYEITSLTFNLDFINLMAYDYYTSNTPFASHHSPLYPHPISKDFNYIRLNANYSTNYWMKKGIPSHKIILGIPFYGRSFKLVNPDINDIGAPINGSGNEGLLTREKGFLSYYEICTNIANKGWAKRVDAYLYGGSQLLTGPYAYDNDQWVGYDDRHHITQKAKFIKELNLGGAMIWAIDLDDFNGICCKIKSPLLKTVNRELRGYSFDLNIFCP